MKTLSCQVGSFVYEIVLDEAHDIVSLSRITSYGTTEPVHYECLGAFVRNSIDERIVRHLSSLRTARSQR